jgi:hypothetical protein
LPPDLRQDDTLTLRRGRRLAGARYRDRALWGPAIVALVLVVLGVVPDQEAALYFAALVLSLLTNAGMLLLVVLRVVLPRVPELGAEGAPGAPTTSA